MKDLFQNENKKKIETKEITFNKPKNMNIYNIFLLLLFLYLFHMRCGLATNRIW